ncbi:MAG: LutB/LldF family L-lactate oxidation iron-sulfur protein [Phycisphaeraceae bacterium]
MTAANSQPVALTSSVGKPQGAEILFPALPYDMHDRAQAATQDEQLLRFVHKATYLKDQSRKRIFTDQFGQRYDKLRDLGGRIKQHTLDHLDYYLEQFIDNATAAGAQVHFAGDDHEANSIAVQIARDINAKLCVKSKSMLTEETHLLPALEAAGCQTIETDLGEFILQLDHDAPSHIVTPMIHKDRTAVGRAFARELGVPYTENADELTQIARQYLREKYRQADLGMSGGNFLVAESGSVVICTNEGNGRLCTSVPDTHIAFVGIEKLIPRREDLTVMLKLLARSSTAQPLTCYTHIMTGPRRQGEHGGPRNMHIILVDNGRTEVLRAETREMLRCIRCGACLNACPVYRKIGGHAYGAVYPGPIGAILTPMLRGLHNYPDLPHASSLCGACYEACPVKIDIPKYLIRLRKWQNQQYITKWADRAVMRLWAWSLKHSATYRLGGWMQKRMLRRQGNARFEGDPYTNRGWIHRLSGPFSGWTEARDMPTPPARNFRDWWRNRN